MFSSVFGENYAKGHVARRAASEKATQQMAMEALASLDTRQWLDVITISAERHLLADPQEVRRLAMHLDQRVDEIGRGE